MKLVVQAWFHDLPVEFGDDAVLTVQVEIDPVLMDAYRGDKAEFMADQIHQNVLTALWQKRGEVKREWKRILPQEMRDQGWLE